VLVLGLHSLEVPARPAEPVHQAREASARVEVDVSELGGTDRLGFATLVGLASASKRG
jgi:hypothetical protein